MKNTTQTTGAPLNSAQVFRNRAVLAYWLHSIAKLKIPDLRLVLRCHGPEEVRRLIARGRRLDTEMRVARGDAARWEGHHHD